MCVKAKQVFTVKRQSGDQFPMVLSPGFGIRGQKLSSILSKEETECYIAISQKTAIITRKQIHNAFL